MRRVLALLLVVGLAASCKPANDDKSAQQGDKVTGSQASASPADQGQGPAPQQPGQAKPVRTLNVKQWLYQLQNYPNGRLDSLQKAPGQVAVIDLARDAKSDFFQPHEIAALKKSGKTVLAYFEIGSIENFRPEYNSVKSMALNQWDDWPEEYFVRYWEQAWWDKIVKPRMDQAAKAGFDGVYLDTPLAYEEIDLKLVRGESRDSLGRKMAELIVRISKYNHNLLIFPQNSPELRKYPGYTEAIDGIGMEELFYLATDELCDEDFCSENLAETRALRKAGKTVLAVDYASQSDNFRKACSRYTTEGFAGYVTTRELDTITRSCS